jgi:hypothetical protein
LRVKLRLAEGHKRGWRFRRDQRDQVRDDISCSLLDACWHVKRR